MKLKHVSLQKQMQLSCLDGVMDLSQKENVNIINISAGRFNFIVTTQEVFDENGKMYSTIMADAITQGLKNAGINPNSTAQSINNTASTTTSGYNLSNASPDYTGLNVGNNLDTTKINSKSILNAADLALFAQNYGKTTCSKPKSQL